ncbi:hypothetical protein SAMN05444161_7008 [Rhizobiales bacterium GAS191]|nr:hypothetical protein SAMN05519103_06314 [Rhizobiales bacterium GAS113]SEE75351.1 hypothetical protein SAMN05444161_7008 [Rhizobiales bacterium GAS191]
MTVRVQSEAFNIAAEIVALWAARYRRGRDVHGAVPR